MNNCARANERTSAQRDADCGRVCVCVCARVFAAFPRTRTSHTRFYARHFPACVCVCASSFCCVRHIAATSLSAPQNTSDTHTHNHQNVVINLMTQYKRNNECIVCVLCAMCARSPRARFKCATCVCARIESESYDAEQHHTTPIQPLRPPRGRQRLENTHTQTHTRDLRDLV